MDRNSPDFYVEESANASAAETLAFVQEMMAKASDRILPVITPRFVPTCTPELMGQLGDIAKTYDIPIQSHLSESKAECSWVKVRCGRIGFDMISEWQCCATASFIARHDVS